MSENEPRPSENAGAEPTKNAYGQPSDSSFGGERGGSTAYPPPSDSPQQPPSYGRSPYGQPQHGQPPYGQPQHGQPPYGQPPYGEAPYGEAPYGEAPYGEAPYGQAPYGQAPYGQAQYSQHQPYGQPAYPQPQSYGQPAYGSAPYGDAYDNRGDSRPVTVTAAAWTTIVLGALGILGNLFFALMVVVGQDFVGDELASDPGFEESGLSVDAVVGLTVVFFLGLAVWSAANLLLGIFVLRRSNIARILLVISCALTALISLALAVSGGIGILSLVPAVVVIVLLFVGGASDWFAHKGQPSHGKQYEGSPYGP